MKTKQEVETLLELLDTDTLPGEKRAKLSKEQYIAIISFCAAFEWMLDYEPVKEEMKKLAKQATEEMIRIMQNLRGNKNEN